MREKPITDKASYARGYAAALKRRGVPAEPAIPWVSRPVANFDVPSGRRVTLSFPSDMSLADLEYFAEVSAPYFAAHKAAA